MRPVLCSVPADRQTQLMFTDRVLLPALLPTTHTDTLRSVSLCLQLAVLGKLVSAREDVLVQKHTCNSVIRGGREGVRVS